MSQLSGTYRGLGEDLELFLRLDVDGPSALNMLSGELNQSVRLLDFNYFNLRRHSFIGDDITRTEQGNCVVYSTPIRFFRLPELTGRIDVEIDPTSAVAKLKLTGYGYHRQPLAFALEKESDYFRTVRLEIDQEEGTELPGPFKPWEMPPGNLPSGMPEEPITIQSAFQRAGVEVIVHPVHSTIPPAMAEAGAAWTAAELHNAMMSYFSLISNDPTWNVWLMIGNLYANPRVSGIMFDQTDPLPRQGAAVFYSRFADLEEEVKHRNFVRTAVHELGHALNLLHSFQKGVLSELGFGDNPFMTPRSDSLSFMNYTWRYPYGHNRPWAWDGTEDYWARHKFEFDEQELMHLRHHDRLEVIFGGEAFGVHGHSRIPALEPREITSTNERSLIRLELRGKRVNDKDVRAFELMEPIHLELKLAPKEGEREVPIVDHLDPTDGLVCIYIEKPTGETVKFRPLMTTCYDEPKTAVVTPDMPLYRDLHLTFGKDGFYFQEPGVYAVRAVYLGGERLTAYSNVLTVRVATPKLPIEEELAAEFFDPIKGQLLAVGPSASAQFSPQIEFFKGVVRELPDGALGKALAAYLGMVEGIPFKDIGHEFATEKGVVVPKVVAQVTKAHSKEGMDYLDMALKNGTSPSLSNLMRCETGINRVRVLESAGDIAKAKSAVDDVEAIVSGAIAKNKKLRQSVVDDLEKMKERIGTK